jgi:hypothetical protein
MMSSSMSGHWKIGEMMVMLIWSLASVIEEYSAWPHNRMSISIDLMQEG